MRQARRRNRELPGSPRRRCPLRPDSRQARGRNRGRDRPGRRVRHRAGPTMRGSSATSGSSGSSSSSERRRNTPRAERSSRGHGVTDGVVAAPLRARSRRLGAGAGLITGVDRAVDSRWAAPGRVLAVPDGELLTHAFAARRGREPTRSRNVRCSSQARACELSSETLASTRKRRSRWPSRMTTRSASGCGEGAFCLLFGVHCLSRARPGSPGIPTARHRRRSPTIATRRRPRCAPSRSAAARRCSSCAACSFWCGRARRRRFDNARVDRHRSRRSCGRWPGPQERPSTARCASRSPRFPLTQAARTRTPRERPYPRRQARTDDRLTRSTPGARAAFQKRVIKPACRRPLQGVSRPAPRAL
jgi:hypothetical protein